jgi:hypothetical protein
VTLPGPMATSVVFDVNVLVLATGKQSTHLVTLAPPTSGNPFADCLGIINDSAEFAL